MSLFVYDDTLNKLEVSLGGGSLLQVANRAGAQMMTYFIKTPDGKNVIIDSGHDQPEDAEHLYELIKQNGKTVDMWFITHAHCDHTGGITRLIESGMIKDIEIKELRFSFPDIDWLLKTEQNEGRYTERFLKDIESAGINVGQLEKDMSFSVGGMEFEILNSCERYDCFPEINDTTVVILAKFPEKNVLFLGDLGATGGERLQSECDIKKLRCDIVQMAHHGQNGVKLSFYDAVCPRICLYTAPDWLWDCDNGGGLGSGEWKTLETREYMKKFGTVVSCPNAYGDYLLF